MIRKVACLIFLVVYLTTTAGFALTIHFCGSKIASVEVEQKASKKCCTTKADDCCKNTNLNIKVKDQHKSSAQFQHPDLYPTFLFINKRFISTAEFPLTLTKDAIASNAPPYLSAENSYLKYCVFRI